ncbi:hypothetical protein H5410_026434 [Solanum commersonii]|uniref:Uncharacterized protein n=1 Tax=Solanum commersonii TaxID=4109 RepID=A0A9J5Z1J0_SOLCO|nr:hypothetical protein H5410_026434 [Solanum commersonii]
MKSVGPDGQTGQFSRPNDPRSWHIPILPIFNSDVENVEYFLGRSLRPKLRSWLALKAIPNHFQGKMSPEEGTPLILSIFMCYTPWIF